MARINATQLAGRAAMSTVCFIGLSVTGSCVGCADFVVGYGFSGTLVDADTNEPIGNTRIIVQIEDAAGQTVFTSDFGNGGAALTTDQTGAFQGEANGFFGHCFFLLLPIDPLAVPEPAFVVTRDADGGWETRIEVRPEMISPSEDFVGQITLGTVAVPAGS